MNDIKWIYMKDKHEWWKESIESYRNTFQIHDEYHLRRSTIYARFDRALETLLQRFQPEMLCRRNASVAAQRGVSPHSLGYEAWKCTSAAVGRSSEWFCRHLAVIHIHQFFFDHLSAKTDLRNLWTSQQQRVVFRGRHRFSASAQLLHVGIWGNEGITLLTAVAFRRLVDLQQEVFVLGFQPRILPRLKNAERCWKNGDQHRKNHIK